MGPAPVGTRRSDPMHARAVVELKTQGYTVLHDRVPPTRLEALRAALDKVHRDEAHVPRQAVEANGLRGSNLVRRAEIFRQALQRPEVIAIVEALLGMRLHPAQLRVAPASAGWWGAVAAPGHAVP